MKKPMKNPMRESKKYAAGKSVIKASTLLILLVCWVLVVPSYSQPKSSTTPPRAYTTFMVDDFEDGNHSENPNWWQFGNVEISVVDNIPRSERVAQKLDFVGDKSLHIVSQTKGFYGGGLGTYLGIDTRKFDAIKFVMFGDGDKGTKIQIELYDDDNGNWKIEENPNYPSSTAYDDVWVYTLDVNWSGWKVAIIPLSAFVDDNPTIGDNTWNPYQVDKSGGLIQMQMVLLSETESERVDIKIDDIKFYSQNQIDTYIQEAEKRKAEAERATYPDYNFDDFNYGDFDY